MSASPEGAGAVVWLDEEAAADATVTGAKAAALARARTAGLPVLPGFVLTTRATAPCRTGEPRLLPGLEAEVRAAWERLSEGGQVALVVRSSSTAEDGAESSMAGRFISLLDIRGWDGFLAAVDDVLSSSHVLSLEDEPQAVRAPMAVLVQPLLQPAIGGVLFGADPLSGSDRRLVAAAVNGGPDRLVHGDVDGSHHTLTRRGRLLESAAGDGGVPLDRHTRRALARVARRTAALYGGPQDMEWAGDGHGRVWLLQSRPITALPPRAARGPVLGPGPVAETFPDPLSPLEVDLWVAPLADGVVEALRITGAVSESRLRRSPVVTAVGGRVVADLELLGAWHPRRRFLASIDPRPPARRLAAAWRVGRLRAALPALARDLCSQVDHQLVAVPSVDRLRDAELLDLLQRSRQALAAVHGHEVLLGLHLGHHAEATTGASLGLQVLARERAKNNTDDAILATYPVVLALTAPTIGPPAPLPPTSGSSTRDSSVTATGDEIALLREALRLRARWLHELSARAAWQLAQRLCAFDLVTDPAQIRLLRLDELTALVRFGVTPGDLDGRDHATGPSLPSAFRLSPEGVPVRVPSSSGDGPGSPAAGGRATGIVHDGSAVPAPGAVLVVQSLDPRLAPMLPRLAAIVAETGSPLSHLAILAREIGLPVVVGVPDAVARFPAGTVLDVDGDAGTVRVFTADVEVAR